MTKNQLKNIIRDCINESLMFTEITKQTKVAQESAVILNNMIGKMINTELQSKARVHAAKIIKLINDDVLDIYNPKY